MLTQLKIDQHNIEDLLEGKVIKRSHFSDEIAIVFADNTFIFFSAEGEGCCDECNGFLEDIIIDLNPNKQQENYYLLVALDLGIIDIKEVDEYKIKRTEINIQQKKEEKLKQ